MMRRLGWSAPDVREYQQRDGRVVFEVATFTGKDADENSSRTQADPAPAPP